MKKVILLCVVMLFLFLSGYRSKEDLVLDSECNIENDSGYNSFRNIYNEDENKSKSGLIIETDENTIAEVGFTAWAALSLFLLFIMVFFVIPIITIVIIIYTVIHAIHVKNKSEKLDRIE